METTSVDPPTIHFHYVTIGQKRLSGQERRHAELADAAARSHAALVSYAKNRTQRRASKSPSSKHAAIKSEHPATDAASCSAILSINTGPLDPFVSLTIFLSPYDRSLVHEYLLSAPQQIYGTTPKSLFCPVRISSLVGIASNEIWLRWMLYLVEHRRTQLRGESIDSSATLLRRRTANYRAMQQIIAVSDPSTLSDEVFYSLVSAGAAEFRVNRPSTATKHLEAGLMLVDARRKANKPLPDISTTGLISCSTYIGYGVRDYFRTPEALAFAQSNVCQRLRSVQTWILAMRQQHRHSPGVVPCGATHSLVSATSHEQSPISPPTTSYPFLLRHIHAGLTASSTSLYATRTCLGILFALISTLWSCRHDELASTEYLRELEQYIRGSEAPTCSTAAASGGDVRDERELRLAPMTILWIVSFCGSRVQEKYGGQGRGGRLYDFWEVVEFVELVVHVGGNMAGRTREALGSWILVGLGEREEEAKMVVLEERERERKTTVREVGKQSIWWDGGGGGSGVTSMGLHTGA
ncbi:uncharacterized protein AB675_7731 [Cyphellophora attinorum]|uniref:Transcription factor domain-containing protein n=1 Tax=Cyphellophora attinorum TaxID=1664694 RepID=A0A0N1HUC2_9EURO|nr:uncharacterized protein AB675_7731 [Phialophora attinorum]KPI40474.1 hypothetical protein AB675_7731 [Phialophora attinorum]